MSKKKTRRISLEKTINGIVYSGYSLIEGTKRLHQTIYFDDISSRYDSKEYKIGEENSLEHFANVIFTELVEEYLKRTNT